MSYLCHVLIIARDETYDGNDISYLCDISNIILECDRANKETSTNVQSALVPSAVLQSFVP